MTALRVMREQQVLAPTEELVRYAGRWVLLRDGKVVASALSPKELIESPGAQSSDVLVNVPDSGTHTSLL